MKETSPRREDSSGTQARKDFSTLLYTALQRICVYESEILLFLYSYFSTPSFSSSVTCLVLRARCIRASWVLPKERAEAFWQRLHPIEVALSNSSTAMHSHPGIMLAIGFVFCLIVELVAASSDAIPSVPSLVFGAIGLALLYFAARAIYLYNSDSKAGREYRRSWSEWNRKRKAVSSDIKLQIMLLLLSAESIGAVFSAVPPISHAIIKFSLSS